MGPRRVVVLGATGSIGKQAIAVARAHPDLLQIVALAAGRDADGLRREASALGVEITALGGEQAEDLARLEEADVVLNAIVGAAGLKASVAALEAGKILALANKESLIAGGEVCRRAASRGGGSIVPVDSEHVAIAQCLEGIDDDAVERIVLTASGGPFRTRDALDDVTPRDALAHPTWQMGPKITVDSATLMNKGLEVIEAHHLFGFDYDGIGIVVHPQSVVHGIVEFVDGTMVMQAAPTDMRIPIQWALVGERVESRLTSVPLTDVGQIEFEELDRERFPAVDLAYEAGTKGRSYPAVLNAANEVAVHSFLREDIGFTDITGIVENVLAAHSPVDVTTLEAVLEVDAWAREEAHQVSSKLSSRSGAGERA